MAGNFLEQLIAEWYEYHGYFVRRNVQVGKRRQGGYECELDVVALHPERRLLVQVEPSMDADSWGKREQRFRRKFQAGQKYIPSLFSGLELPGTIEQIAVFVFASTRNVKTIGGGKVVLIGDLLTEIFSDLRSKHLTKRAVPENLPILRALQFVASYRDVVWNALTGNRRGPDQGM